MQTICRPSSVYWGRAKAGILLLLALQTLMLSCPTPGETAGWKATGPLTTARTRHTATLLGNGQVLVAGGDRQWQSTSAELYDPATRTWSAHRPAHHCPHPSHGHPAAQRPGAGGRGLLTASRHLTSAELYDPATGTWRPPAPSPLPAMSHGHPPGQRPGAGGRGAWRHGLLGQRRALRSGHEDLEPPPARSATARYVAHRHPAAQRPGAGGRGLQRLSWLLDQRRALRPGHGDLERHRPADHCPQRAHGHPAAQRQGAGGRGL